LFIAGTNYDITYQDEINIPDDEYVTIDFPQTTEGEQMAFFCGELVINFDPIGDLSNKFMGVYDGNGYTISNFIYNNLTNSHVGLFSSSGGTIKNVGIINVSIGASNFIGALIGINHGSVDNSYASLGEIKGGTVVGGLVGSNYGDISSSSFYGDVNGSSSSIGGLIGKNENGTISDSYSSGNVEGDAFNVGGLIGRLSWGNVTNSSSSSAVIGGFYIGGLVGYNSAGIIKDKSHATGQVMGYSRVGGLVGYLHSSNEMSAMITETFATGNVVGGSDNVGGLVGYVYFDGAIHNSYATGNVNGSDNVGGLVGRLDRAHVSNSYALGNVNGDDKVGGLIGGAPFGGASYSFAAGAVSADLGDNVRGLGGFSGTFMNSHWDINTTGQDEGEDCDPEGEFGLLDPCHAKGHTTEEMYMESTYVDWNFSNIWDIDEGNNYPTLRMQGFQELETYTVFVSSFNITTPNLLEPPTGDTLCQEAASNADLNGTYIALLSKSFKNVSDLIPNVKYERVDGMKVADSKGDLFDGSIDYSIRVTELGDFVGIGVLTGTWIDGTTLYFGAPPFELQTCDDWQGVSPDPPWPPGFYGSSTNNDGNWVAFAGTNCGVYFETDHNADFKLYCFQVDPID